MIESPWVTALAAAAALYWAVTVLRVGRGMAGIGFLRDQVPVGDGKAAGVSICVAARNEEGKVADGVRSMVGLDDPALEVVAVDDCSEDATGEIRVSWYDSLGDAVRGLSRSLWAGLDYSLAAAAGSLAVTLALSVWPWVGAVVTSGPARWLNLVAVVGSAGLFAGTSRYSAVRPWLAIL